MASSSSGDVSQNGKVGRFRDAGYCDRDLQQPQVSWRTLARSVTGSVRT